MYEAKLLPLGNIHSAICKKGAKLLPNGNIHTAMTCKNVAKIMFLANISDCFPPLLDHRLNVFKNDKYFTLRIPILRYVTYICNVMNSSLCTFCVHDKLNLQL